MRTAWNKLLEPCTTSYPAAFHPAHVLTCSVTPALCWASAMRLSLTGWAFADAHARCKHSANAATPLRNNAHARHIILCKSYFIFKTSLLYLRVSLCYNGLDPVGFARCVCLAMEHRAFSFIQHIGKWTTDLANSRYLRSRFLLRPLPSGRASLAVIIVYTI